MEKENDIVDEIMTPGCPQCAVKHLSAAIAHMSGIRGSFVPPRPEDVLCARAAINAVEAVVGYASHRWLAIGLMTQAEEVAARYGGSARVRCMRAARMLFAGKGDPGCIEKVYESEGEDYRHVVMAVAHWEEAHREAKDDVAAPGFYMRDHVTAEGFVERAVEVLGKLHEDYFKVGQAEESGVHKAD